jgi:hypothetical protein
MTPKTQGLDALIVIFYYLCIILWNCFIVSGIVWLIVWHDWSVFTLLWLFILTARKGDIRITSEGLSITTPKD